MGLEEGLRFARLGWLVRDGLAWFREQSESIRLEYCLSIQRHTKSAGNLGGPSDKTALTSWLR
jgi:hypothetical protein